jgi:hypothetical protein
MIAIGLLLATLVSACLDSRPAPRFRALVFSRTTGYRHDAIPSALDAIRQLAQTHDFGVDATEDPSIFADSTLARYQVVVFALTTGDVLSEAEQSAFERYMRSGRVFPDARPHRTGDGHRV